MPNKNSLIYLTILVLVAAILVGIINGAVLLSKKISTEFAAAGIWSSLESKLQELFRLFQEPLPSLPPSTSTPPQPPSEFIKEETDQKIEEVAPPEPQSELYSGFTEQERAIIKVVKQASPAVVSIIISKDVPILEKYFINPFEDLPKEFQPFFEFKIPQLRQKGTERRQVGGGTGFIIDSEGMILTNKHVVAQDDASYTVFTNEGKKYEAEVLARDPVQDIAILKIQAKNLPTLKLGDSDKIVIGQSVIAIGNALGEFRNTVSVGIVSGLGRSVTAAGGGIIETIEDVVQTDAAINQGNSGGPLLNLAGEVIGINTAMAFGAENIGFAIPINKAKRAIRSIKATGKIIVPYLGVRYIMINPEIKSRYGLAVDFGALILRGDSSAEPAVVPGSAAEKAGLREGDIILELNGQRVDPEHTLGSLIQKYDVGDRINLKVLRQESIITLEAILGGRE